MFGLVRRDDWSHEQFADYFLNDHIPLTRQALADEGIAILDYWSVLPVDPTASPYDGVGGITFPDLDTFQRTTETEGWDRAIADVQNFTRPEENAVVVGTEQIHVDEADGQAAEQAKELVRQHIRIPETGEFEKIDELHTPDYVGHGLAPGAPLDRAGLRQFHMAIRTGLPDNQITIHEQVVEGNFVATRWTATGTHRGELLGLPASGNPVTFSGLSLHRIEGEQIAESWTQSDLLGLMSQIGVVVVLPHWVATAVDTDALQELLQQELDVGVTILTA